ncbi:hypothetical protein GUJ93_ZPchr0005g15330 [Zizania palustris]|uniref:Uncharacterized protein n=1 Tax=Zizania palustris TaxID=103762 RepID=A0A8J5SY94_ZIZPA|nr:hypothetical protein GUJ93_ZPchr0005g15330 [Zizania palustris]
MSLTRAFELRAKIDEAARTGAKNNQSRAQIFRPAIQQTPANSAAAAGSTAVQTAPVPRTGRFQRHTLMPEEMQTRREASLCYNCDEKFSPGHRCKRLFWLCAPSVDDDEASDLKDTNDPGISLYAVAGIRPRDSEMIHLAIFIGGLELVALVDTGSTQFSVREGCCHHRALS